MPTPPFAAPEITSEATSGLAQMVRAGLSATPKQLQPAYFYDALGSALFEAITLLPEYAITRAEEGLLRTHGADILAVAGAPRELIELGPGSGEKLALLLAHGGTASPHIRLIDVSASALKVARNRLRERFEVEVSLCTATFTEGLAALPPPRGQRLVLLLGSNLGNFTPREAVELLHAVRCALAPGDALLLGVDLVKAEPTLLAAYDDPLGVTAAFNKNILARINRELGSNFDLLAFDHRAIWNAPASRIEMHLVSVVEQTVELAALDLAVPFAAGESIWTESSHKYTALRFRELVESAGFRFAGEWQDETHGFLEALFVV